MAVSAGAKEAGTSDAPGASAKHVARCGAASGAESGNVGQLRASSKDGQGIGRRASMRKRRSLSSQSQDKGLGTFRPIARLEPGSNGNE